MLTGKTCLYNPDARWSRRISVICYVWYVCMYNVYVHSSTAPHFWTDVTINEGACPRPSNQALLPLVGVSAQGWSSGGGGIGIEGGHRKGALWHIGLRGVPWHLRGLGTRRYLWHKMKTARNGVQLRGLDHRKRVNGS